MAKDPTSPTADPTVAAANASPTVSPTLYMVLKPITYQGPVDETTIDALLRGARLAPAHAAEAMRLGSDKAALVAWYKRLETDKVTHPAVPAVLLPFDHLAEPNRALLIRRRIIALPS